MIAIELSPEIEERLTLLARSNGKSEASYAHDALLEHIEDMEDIRKATERLRNPGKTYSAGEMKRGLGV